MKKLSLFLLVFVLLVGCGYNPDKPVYDIAANSDGFPPAALELLKRVQSDSLMPADSVMECFTNLYLADQSLLDNLKWKDVVRKLGMKFRYQADRMAERGIEGYSKAAAYYALASCARPDDLRAKDSYQLFSCWNDSIAAAVTAFMDRSDSAPVTAKSITERLHLVKRFMSRDSLSNLFARDYLVDRFLGDLRLKENLPFLLSDSLPDADLALLSHFDLASVDFGKPLAEFENPRIDLVLFEISRLDSLQWLAELYFLPRERVDTDYTVALWVSSTDSVVAGGVSGSRRLPFDFEPTPSTSGWKVDKIVAAYRHFDFADDISAVSVGLYRPDDEGVTYLLVLGSDSSIIEIPFSGIAVQ